MGCPRFTSRTSSCDRSCILCTLQPTSCRSTVPSPVPPCIHVGKSDSYVRNSHEFAEFIQSVMLQSDEILASFDAVSLFTNIQVDSAVRVAKQRLQQDNTLTDHTSLEVEEVVDLSDGNILCFPRVSVPADVRNSNGLPCVRNSSKFGDGGHRGESPAIICPSRQVLETICG